MSATQSLVLEANCPDNSIDGERTGRRSFNAVRVVCLFLQRYVRSTTHWEFYVALSRAPGRSSDKWQISRTSFPCSRKLRGGPDGGIGKVRACVPASLGWRSGKEPRWPPKAVAAAEHHVHGGMQPQIWQELPWCNKIQCFQQDLHLFLFLLLLLFVLSIAFFRRTPLWLHVDILRRRRTR